MCKFCNCTFISLGYVLYHADIHLYVYLYLVITLPSMLSHVLSNQAEYGMTYGYTHDPDQHLAVFLGALFSHSPDTGLAIAPHDKTVDYPFQVLKFPHAICPPTSC